MENTQPHTTRKKEKNDRLSEGHFTRPSHWLPFEFSSTLSHDNVIPYFFPKHKKRKHKSTGSERKTEEEISTGLGRRPLILFHRSEEAGRISLSAHTMSSRPTHCFEVALLVTLEGLEDTIKFCYPPTASSSSLVRQAPAFCFPEQQSFRTSILLLK